MADTFGAGESSKSKADAVADAINNLLRNLTIKCAKGEGIRDYYEVGVIGYGSSVGSAFKGELAGQGFVPISQVANNPFRVEERIKKIDDGAGGLVDQKVRFPVWFESSAGGGTPMCQALNLARGSLTDWLNQHPSSFPPIVINITDGESNDGDPTSEAEAIRELSSDDGNVLLFNLHLSSQRTKPVEFPDSVETLPDEYAKLLFSLSSLLPAYMQDFARQENYSVSEKTRGFVFNADIVSVIRFLDIGTRPSNLR
ncbi:vWA domain-containing protein [Pseudanabaena sp. SR411]|uniref:vWA domain-containing protein n=1 Tax=Pseudanabaena sp. SR411 TaxID=1980935 RepID=UPI0020CD4B17|nr:vWA domain-containing protein [Pseudanabaena sp. SR411]